MSRSVTVVLAYLMTYRGMTLLDALMLVRSKRKCAYPNIGFFQQLMTLEKELRPGMPPSIPMGALQAHHLQAHAATLTSSRDGGATHSRDVKAR